MAGFFSGFMAIVPLKALLGKAIMLLLLVDYKVNDLGDYNEGAISFVVTTPGQTIRSSVRKSGLGPPVRVPAFGQASPQQPGVRAIR